MTDDNELNRARHAEFGAAVHARLFESPFGSLPKSELEILLFTELVQAKIIDLDQMSSFELARKLRCTPTKANNLLFNHRLREAPNDEEARQNKLADVTKIVKNTKNSNDGEVTLNVEDRFWRDELINQLKRQNIFTDTSFNRERLTLDAKLFYKACPDLFGRAGNEIANAAKSANSRRGKFAKKLISNLSTGATTRIGSLAAEKIAGGMSISDVAEAIANAIS